jgi:hypothetical protein
MRRTSPEMRKLTEGSLTVGFYIMSLRDLALPAVA